jgi:hypothetical protein
VKLSALGPQSTVNAGFADCQRESSSATFVADSGTLDQWARS